MNTDTITPGSRRLPQRARRAVVPRLLRERGGHPERDEQLGASDEPREAADSQPQTAVTSEAECRPADETAAARPSDAEEAEEFVWTPAKRVSVLAALVWIHGANPDADSEPPRLTEEELRDLEEAKPTFGGLNNALRAGLARNPQGNWHLTPEGIEQLREHKLLDTYTVTPVAA
jgi:hypothetical protein